MPPGGERPPRAALPRQLSPAGEESAGAGSKSPAQPRGTPGRGPAFWLLLAVGGRWGDSYTWGGKFRLVVGAGAGARRGGLCAPVGLGMGRGEMEGWSGSGSLPPHTCSPGPGSAWNESPCLTLRGSPSVKTYPPGVLAEEAWLWPQIWLQPI